MPGLDGFSLLETLRGDPSLEDIPVIVFTAADLNEEQRKRLENFSQDMIRKGLVSDEELFQTIDRALNSYRFPLGENANSDS
jgi:CheY-like chemotaxis protein